MDYQRIYNEIIERAKGRSPKELAGVYTEKHHIIPVCCGGSDLKENLITLNGREHFICHWLLSRINTKDKYHKLHYAFRMMSTCNKGRGYKVTSYAYAAAMKASSDATKKNMTGRTHNRGRKHSKLTVEKNRQTSMEASPLYKLPAILTTKYGKPFKVNCLFKFCRDNNILKTNIPRAYKGEIKTAAGYGVFPIDTKNPIHPSTTKKLIKSDVVKIMLLLSKGESLENISKKFNVHWATIKDIAIRRSWKDVPFIGEPLVLEKKLKISKTDITDIESRLHLGESVKSIARDYKVDYSTISCIRSGEHWLQPTPTKKKTNYKNKLTVGDVKMIRKLLYDGIRQSTAAFMFGVTISAISSISQGKSWKHVKI